MSDENELITVRMPESLLEGLEDLYGEEGPYEDRTEAMLESISMHAEKTSNRSVNPQYDSLVTEYVKALGNNKNSRAEELKDDILEYFPETKLAEELE